jgi:hypothetical protein
VSFNTGGTEAEFALKLVSVQSWPREKSYPCREQNSGYSTYNNLLYRLRSIDIPVGERETE